MAIILQEIYLEKEMKILQYFSTIEEPNETILDFSKGTVKVL